MNSNVSAVSNVSGATGFSGSGSYGSSGSNGSSSSCINDSLLDTNLVDLLDEGSTLSPVPSSSFGPSCGDGEETGAAMLIDTTSVMGENRVVDTPPVADLAGRNEQSLREHILRLQAEIGNHIESFSRARTSGDEATALNELRSIDNLRKGLKTLKECQEMFESSSEPSNKRQFTTSGGGLALSRKDLPKFQLVTSLVRPFPHEEVFESAEHFLKTFEKVVASAGRDVEQVWRSFFPLCLPNSEDAWYETEMKLCPTWKEARLLFKESHSSKAAVRQYTHQVFTMEMKVGEPLVDYYKRFLQAVYYANLPKDNERIADRFLASLTPEVQTVIKMAMFSDNSGSIWTVDKMAQHARNVLGDDPKRYGAASGFLMPPSTSRGGSPRSNPVTKDKRVNKKKARKTFFCSQHGHNTTHHSKDCFTIKRRTAGTSTGDSNNKGGNRVSLCRRCKAEPWSPGHKCKGKNRVLAVKRGATSTDADAKEQELEQAAAAEVEQDLQAIGVDIDAQMEDVSYD